MKNIIVWVALSALLGGCAGRAANPVMVDQVGDNRKSCDSLETEMKTIQADVQKLLPETDKAKKNVGLALAGAFIVVPFFFMDFTESEKIEVDAYRLRYNRLQAIATEKKCQFIQVYQETGEKTATN